MCTIDLGARLCGVAALGLALLVGCESKDVEPGAGELGPGVDAGPGPIPACMSWRYTPELTCADPRPHDLDADGYRDDVDCNEHDPYAYPGASEAINCNGVDEDCDGVDLCIADDDRDGWLATVDCNDRDATIHPDAPEVNCDRIDQDCTGFDWCDLDGDRRGEPIWDCDETNPDVYVGASEVNCNDLDDDCQGGDCCMNDGDRDGWACKDDCRDDEPHYHPGATMPEEWGPCFPAVDIDCDGDLDGTCGTG